ncbi:MULTISPECIES: bifunctional DNA primase/polymerase [unclassified Janthinobacterium]|uniref:bifunctional DNA primase/polymerase n=1 Tax=unclassified Janthinobacterium TaxID=2610881 RepID=UPI0009D92317|nr:MULTISPECIES: bifunctional DNA primase/polymerase [unclassified Janthinobacterium]MEC5159776.1 hypothetical protein [Janthinobacterium sp. CG_S6]
MSAGMMTESSQVAFVNPARAAAITCAGLGIPVFPVHGVRDGVCTCGFEHLNNSIGKHPCGGLTFRDATTDVKAISVWFDRWPDMNYGIATGVEIKGGNKMLVVVDVDSYKGGADAAMDAFDAAHGKMPETAEVQTGGGGRHLYFLTDCGKKFRSTLGNAGIDFKGIGGYVIGPGSLHRSGRRYEWEASSDPSDGQAIADLPAWVIEQFGVKEAVPTSAASSISGDVSEAEIAEYQAHLDVIAADDYAIWCQVLMALKNRSASEQMFALADRWSQKCPEKYNATALRHKWDKHIKAEGGITIKTLERLADPTGMKGVNIAGIMNRSAEKDAGARLDVARSGMDGSQHQLKGPAPTAADSAHAELIVVQQAEVLRRATEVVEGNQHAVPTYSDCDDLGARLPPVMAELASWSRITGRTVQPAFMLCAALAACSSVLSRDFIGAGGAHTNLYCVAVGPTACGKENAIDSVVKIVTAYDPMRLAGVPASDAGVLAAMKRNAAGVFVIDEIGEVLKSIFDEKAAGYKALIGTVFMELYTKGGKAYRGKEYGNQTPVGGKPREDIFSPCPSIFGATTATTLFDAINSTAVGSGFLPRLMVFRAPDMIPMPNLDWVSAPIPNGVVAWLDAIRTRVAQHAAAIAEKGDLIGVSSNNYQPIDVPYSDSAVALFRAEQIKIVNRRNATADILESNMLSRVVENAGRVALTLALAENPWVEEVSAKCFSDAMDIVNESTQRFIADIRENLFDSGHAKLEAKVLQKITEFFVKNEGKAISDGILVDKCGAYNSAKPQDRKGVIDALIRQGKIIERPGRNKNTRRYFPNYDQD